MSIIIIAVAAIAAVSILTLVCVLIWLNAPKRVGFYWNPHTPQIEALIEKNVVPVLHWDQDWSRDLERLKELPAKKCILNPRQK